MITMTYLTSSEAITVQFQALRFVAIAFDLKFRGGKLHWVHGPLSRSFTDCRLVLVLLRSSMSSRLHWGLEEGGGFWFLLDCCLPLQRDVTQVLILLVRVVQLHLWWVVLVMVTERNRVVV